MKLFTFLSILTLQVASYSVDVNSDPKSAIAYVNENEPWNGEKYYFKYETSLGSVRVEEGFLEDSANGEKSLVQVGFYSIIGVDNQVYLVEYYADESGYNQRSAAPLEEYAKENPTRLTRTIGLSRLNRAVLDSLAGNNVMKDGPICSFIDCEKTLDKVKKWRASRKSG